jgi:hypothetical protein
MLSRAKFADILAVEHGVDLDEYERASMRGIGMWELTGPTGELLELGVFENKITDVGDEYYAKRGAAAVAPAAPADVNKITGMRLGTGATAASKAGAGAAIVTYTTASHLAVDASFPTLTNLGTGVGWRIQYKTTWGAGVATASGLAEAVITNETPLTNVAGSAANTVSRALLSPTVNKGASDTLALTWNHDFLGA